MEKKWFVYIIECADSSLYTGTAVDVQKRFAAHQAGKGAKYTRGRGPLRLVYTEECEDHSHALHREWEIKQLPREEKLALIQKDSLDS